MEDEAVLDHIAELLAAHGVQTSRRGERLVPAEPALPQLAARVFPSDRSVQLDVEVGVPGGAHPLESFGGFGRDRAASTRDALDNFSRSALHVVLAAFYGKVDPDQVTVETWRLAGGEYDAIIGSYTNRSSGGRRSSVPQQVFPCFEKLLRELPGTEPLYWARLYHCNIDASSEPINEVLLNNEEWQAAQAEIAALPWERHDGFSSTRLFLVLRRRTQPG
jgi:hypothetical protein